MQINRISGASYVGFWKARDSCEVPTAITAVRESGIAAPHQPSLTYAFFNSFAIVMSPETGRRHPVIVKNNSRLATRQERQPVQQPKPLAVLDENQVRGRQVLPRFIIGLIRIERSTVRSQGGR